MPPPTAAPPQRKESVAVITHIRDRIGKRVSDVGEGVLSRAGLSISSHTNAFNPKREREKIVTSLTQK
jgi:hypothetical protein